jgi:cysteine-rich repeat protein
MRHLAGLAVFLLLAVGGAVKAANVDVILDCGACAANPDPAILDVGDTLTFTCPAEACAPPECIVFDNGGSISGITPFTQFIPTGETGSPLGPATAGAEYAVAFVLNDLCFPSFYVVLETTPDSTVCGDGVIEVSEECDDGGTAPGDGCDGSCQIETGWTCAGEPSVCTFCGDGLIEGSEQCDDGGTAPGDGCDASCQIEPYWTCEGEPSVCSAIATRALPKWGYLALAAGLIVVGAVVMRRRAG